MGYIEKINIYVPADIKQKLDSDARMFEILKNDRQTINSNRFLTMVLCGYYYEYKQGVQQAHQAVCDILSDAAIPTDAVERYAARIVNGDSSKKENSEHLSYKPTTKTAGIIADIQNSLEQKDSVSQYLRRLLVSYCQKPMLLREKILFKDNVKVITAVLLKKTITFSLIWDERKRHEVIPYAIAESKEEMYNYLVCVENDIASGQPQVRSYRLNRLSNPLPGSRAPSLCKEILDFCERTVRISPQYAINSNEEICVRLNAAGEKLYNRIYYGRPPYERVEPLADGDGHYYYFQCSPDQVYHYFRRFDNNTAVVLFPFSLKNRMIIFHQNALHAYEMTGGKDNV